MGRRGAIVCALIALLGSLVAVPSASAASIAFIGGGDLFLASPDGNKIRRVADVADAAPLRAPSVAPDGTIWVISGGTLVRLAPTGGALGAIVPAVPGTLVDLAVSPDGLLLAYVTADAAGVRTTSYTRADGTGGEADFGSAVGFGGPSFMDATRVVLDDTAGNVVVDTIQSGATPPVAWFGDAAQRPVDGSVNASLQAGAWIGVGADGSTVVGLYSTLGGPPAVATRVCSFNSPGAHDPDWSPDGSTVAFDDDTGIWVAAVPSLASCASLTASKITAAGAREPDWSPADVPVGPSVSADGKPRVAGLALAAAAFPAATGTTLSFSSSAAGTATVVVQKVSTGVKKKRGCVAGTTKRKLQRCTRREVIGAAFQQAVPAGAVALPLARPDLAKGKYEAVVTVTDAIGRVAAPKRIRFTIQ